MRIMNNVDSKYILCGRGPRNYNHEGNVKFRRLIEKNAQVYTESSKGKKTKLVSRLIEQIRNCDMKFMESKEGVWQELTHRESRNKIGHRFRDILREVQRRKSDNSITHEIVDQISLSRNIETCQEAAKMLPSISSVSPLFCTSSTTDSADNESYMSAHNSFEPASNLADSIDNASSLHIEYQIGNNALSVLKVQQISPIQKNISIADEEEHLPDNELIAALIKWDLPMAISKNSIYDDPFMPNPIVLAKKFPTKYQNNQDSAETIKSNVYESYFSDICPNSKRQMNSNITTVFPKLDPILLHDLIKMKT